MKWALFKRKMVFISLRLFMTSVEFSVFMVLQHFVYQSDRCTPHEHHSTFPLNIGYRLENAHWWLPINHVRVRRKWARCNHSGSKQQTATSNSKCISRFWAMCNAPLLQSRNAKHRRHAIQIQRNAASMLARHGLHLTNEINTRNLKAAINANRYFDGIFFNLLSFAHEHIQHRAYIIQTYITYNYMYNVETKANQCSKISGAIESYRHWNGVSYETKRIQLYFDDFVSPFTKQYLSIGLLGH